MSSELKDTLSDFDSDSESESEYDDSDSDSVYDSMSDYGSESEKLSTKNKFFDLLKNEQTKWLSLTEKHEFLKKQNEKLKTLFSLKRQNKFFKKENEKLKSLLSSKFIPCGFMKPILISDELASFLGKELGTKMPRIEVSKEINLYIREHNLNDPDNGRRIIPNDRLTALLKLNQGEELTYFNLQKYMQHHFIREEKTQTL